MDLAYWGVALSIGLFVAMLACLELGYRIGRRHSKKHPESAHEGIGAVEAAVFALLGLLLGFSFAGATSRLDARRQLIVQEANAIGTAYLRLDLLPANDQPELRRLFRDYLDVRLRVYAKLPDLKAAEEEMARAEQLQQEIWSRAVIAGRADASQNVARVLLPALNEMIDVTTSRSIALHTHLPPLIFALLICVALLSGLLAGYAMAERKSRSWLHMLLYAVVVAVTVYVVVDLDYPRSGLIRLDAADNALIKLRDSIQSVR
jgi:hypothetical protein